jgi:phosphoglycerol transferase MdoB-like AlkP superfamily enzyme
MKKRLSLVALPFLVLWLIFILQKPLFMLYQGAVGKGIGVIDFLRVMVHGASLDATMAGYFTVVPLLVALVTVFVGRTVAVRRVLGAYQVLVAALVSLLFVVDAGLYTFWGFKLDAVIFVYLDSPKDVLASVSALYVAVAVGAWLLLTAGTAWALIRVMPKQLEPIRSKALRAGTALLTLGLAGLLFVVIRGGVMESTANVGQVYFCNDQFLNHSAVNPDFSLMSSMGKSKDFASEFDYFPEEEREEAMRGLYPAYDAQVSEGAADEAPHQSLLRTSRPNILLIMIEGFGGTFIEPLGGLPDVTPRFNQLTREGVFFTQCYANSFRTDRGVVCTLSGHLGLPTASIMKVPAKSRTLPSLSQSLQRAGYATDFLYGGDINFTNMKGFLLSQGYERLTAETDFTLAEQTYSKWGVNDGVTADYLYEQLSARPVKGEKPWFTTYLTLSSHEPFEVPYHRLEDPIQNGFAYTDECLGQLIDRLKQSPQWDNLLVILLPDHGFRYPQSAPDRGGEFSHIPLLWLGGALQGARQVGTLMNQADLAATLLSQLEVSHDDFLFSRDVMSPTYRYPFAFYTSADAMMYRDSTGTTGYDLRADRVTYEEPAKGSAERIRKAKAILQTAYDDLGKR